MKKRTVKIKKQFTGLLTTHTLLLVALLFIVFAVTVTVNKFDDIYHDVSNLAHTAADMVDGDAALRYMESGELDDLYYEQKEKLRGLKANFSDCHYIYIFSPTEENAVYLYDIYTDAEYATGEVDEGAFGYNETWDNLTAARELYETGGEQKKLEVTLFSEYGSAVTYYAPVYASQGQLAAIVGIDYSFSAFVTFMIFLLVCLLVVIIFLTFIMLDFELKTIEREIVAPVVAITEKANLFANSEHDGNSEQYLLPEIENPVNELDILSSSMNSMIHDIDKYIENIETITKERARIGIELDVANRIQASYLPRIFPPFPDRDEFDIYASMTPAKEVGGDFYDFFLIDDNHIGLVIADVSGKGVGAALFMMISKTMLNSQARNCLSPAEILRDVNNRLCENNEAEMFVTVWLGILEISTGRIIAANGGHEFPAFKKANGDYELIKDKHGFVLGGMENTRYKEYEILMEPGDELFVYTDGVPEATNADNELFGTERMIETLNRGEYSDMKQLLENVKEGVDSFVKDAPQFDDLTMLGIRYNGVK